MGNIGNMHIHNYSEHITITDIRIFMHSYNELIELLMHITDLCIFRSPIELILVLVATLCLFRSLVEVTDRGGNRPGLAGLGRANSGLGQNRAEPKLARFFRAKILTSQPALKTGSVGSNSLFKVIKNSGGPGHTGLGHTEQGQIWPGFFLGQ